MNSSRNKWIL